MATDILGFLWNTTEDNTFRLTDPSIGNLEFDTVDQITHEWNREATRNPVENGSPIGDHIIRQPKGITITGMISNAPIAGILTQVSNAIASGFDAEDRVAAAFKILDQLYNSDELVTIYTKYHAYEDMLITNIQIPERPENGDAIVFTVEAAHVRIVETATTELPPGVGIKKAGSGNTPGKKAGTSNSLDKATANRATPNKDIGKNNGTVAYNLKEGVEGLLNKSANLLNRW
ncbi:phage baseplate protein [Serratia odorifera]|uniref:phage baseplate protein n=1 Tax=Serratia odorifera TaxID=618 RepID=UPI003531E541